MVIENDKNDYEVLALKAEYWDKLLELFNETEENANSDDFVTDVYLLKKEYTERVLIGWLK